MSITDELREWFKDRIFMANGWQEIRDIADRIDAEHERQLEVLYRDMSDAEWVRLPKDADGVPIHVGDVMEWCDSGDTLEVIGIGDDTLFYIDPEGDRTYAEWTSARNKRHHVPTVEDVLREFVTEFNRDDSELCDEEIIERFAAKLQLRDDAE